MHARPTLPAVPLARLVEAHESSPSYGVRWHDQAAAGRLGGKEAPLHRRSDCALDIALVHRREATARICAAEMLTDLARVEGCVTRLIVRTKRQAGHSEPSRKAWVPRPLCPD